MLIFYVLKLNVNRWLDVLCVEGRICLVVEVVGRLVMLCIF